MPLEPGVRLGPYEILAPIGRGGMGEVYRARDTSLDRDVAIKVLPAEFASDPERLARFEREAKVLASLNHPNIAHIHGLEKSAEVRAIVMELVEGPTLAELIEQRRALGSGPRGPRATARSSSGGLSALGTPATAESRLEPAAQGQEPTRAKSLEPASNRQGLPLDEALPIVRQIAEALEAAHDQGIIHRDLKPANIKVTPDGVVKVLDFGLAKALDTSVVGRDFSPADVAESPTMSMTAAATRAGFILGTAAYMSPEQASGKPIDKRTDIWAFGVVLWEMLTGAPLFSGETVSHTLAEVLKTDPDWSRLPADVPSQVRRVLRRCLEKDPRKRLRDVGDALLELGDASDETVAGPPAHDRAARPAWWRSPIVTGAAGLGAGVAVAALIWSGSAAPTIAPARKFAIRGPGGGTIALGSPLGRLAISPDGSHLALATGGASAADVGQLYVKALTDFEWTLVAEEQALNNPFFSPDGDQVGYSMYGGLHAVALSGGGPRSIAPLVYVPKGATWGPDDTIVFATQGTGLQRVSAAGGAPEPVTQPIEGEEHRWPEFLPGGRALLFTIATAGPPSMSVALLDLKSEQQSILIPAGGQAHYVAGHIVFALDGTLQAVPFDLERLTVTGRPVPVLEGLATTDEGVSNFVTSTGGDAAYIAGGQVEVSGHRTLVWLDPNGREEPISAIEPGNYEQLDFAPDGTRLVFTDRRVSGADIWSYDLVRGVRSRITTDGGSEYPRWTPDGKRIVFASNADGGGVYSIAADGVGRPELLTSVPGDRYVWDVSPDGRTVLFFHSEPDTGFDLLEVPVEGGEAVPLIATAADERRARLSPDGKWLAYQSDESGEFNVFVRPYPDVSTGKWQISAAGGWSPRWAPDGRRLFYRSGSAMMVVDIDTANGFSASRPRVLFETDERIPLEEFVSGGYAVAPDGDRFLMVRSVEGAGPLEGELRISLNWADELNALVPVD